MKEEDERGICWCKILMKDMAGHTEIFAGDCTVTSKLKFAHSGIIKVTETLAVRNWSHVFHVPPSSLAVSV